MPQSDWKKRYADTQGTGMGPGMTTWSDAVQSRPTPEKVAQLQMSHGLDACMERWGYIPRATLEKMVSKGKRLLRAAA